MISNSPQSFVAIDWSGAESASAQRKGIRVARCAREGGAVELLPPMVRNEVERWLLGLLDPVVVGLDFSFSYPAWFLRELGCSSAPELWHQASERGEGWLREPQTHFWGRRKGSRVPDGHRAPRWLGYRSCELAVNAGGRLPLSSFQIGGAGAVGTGTLRGMPMLARLRAAGWRVWPFDVPGLWTLLEIYPRVLTGAVVKSRASARVQYLAQPRFQGLEEAVRAQAEASEDAFDAVVSAMVMREHADSFAALTQATGEMARLEGAIWRPEICQAASR